MKAILLLAFGGPNSLENVEPFLISLTGKRPPPEQIEEVKNRYRLIGGSSPIIEITFNQARLLEKLLNKKGHPFKSYVGMRYSHPFIEESLKDIAGDGIREVIAIPMTPFRSAFTTEGYKVEINRINEDLGNRLVINFKEGWHLHPLFIEALSERIFEALKDFDEERRRNVHIIFTAHSLPESVVGNDPYIHDMKETIDMVLQRTGLLRWHVAFQSRGRGGGRWIGPDTASVLDELASINVKEVLIVPVGFVSDNIEILYDIDIFYKKKAEASGINIRRTQSLNSSERFIEFLSSLVMEGSDKGLN